jgi:hypothetical protein
MSSCRRADVRFTVIEPIPPNIDYPNHGKSNLLPSWRDTWEEPVDLLVMSGVEDKFICGRWTRDF